MVTVPAQEISVDPADQRSILNEIGRLLAEGRFSAGSNVERFEREFAVFTGARQAVAVASGTVALELILLALNVRDRTVIVPANTNFATFVAAWRAGARVVLADVDPLTLSPRLSDLATVVTADTAAVMLVHMGGIITPQVEQIADWCAARGIALVEDAAHAHASRQDGRHAGTFGVAGAFSFFATKVMTTGEGGMVVTDDENLAQEVRLYRNLGKSELWVSHHSRMGTNGRMHELAAVLGTHQLVRLEGNVAARREVADRYASALADHPDLTLLRPGHPYSGYKVVGLLSPGVNRDQLKERLSKAEIRLAGEVYAEPLHHQPVLEPMYRGLSFPGAERACASQICLPVYPTLGADRVDLVVRVVTEALADLAARHD